MPIAHACPDCGCVLTNVRAGYAHAFRAPVVVCPECSFASVRRRHPTAAAIRLCWRCAWAIYGMVWRGALAAILILVTVFVGESLYDGLRDAGFYPGTFLTHLAGTSPNPLAWDAWIERTGHVTLVMALCWSALVGVLLTGGLAHVKRRWIPWAAFFTLVALCVWAEVAYDTWNWLMLGGSPSEWETTHIDHKMYRAPDLSKAVGPRARHAIGVQNAIAITSCAMLLAIPLGLLVRRAILRRDARRFTRKRAYLRSRRNRA